MLFLIDFIYWILRYQIYLLILTAILKVHSMGVRLFVKIWNLDNHTLTLTLYIDLPEH